MMKKLLFSAIVALAFTFIGPAHAQQVRVVTTCGSVSPYHALNPGSVTSLYVDTNGNICGGGGGGGGSAFTVSHASTTALANNLNAKGSSGSLLGFNCSGITGGAAGFCIAYNGATTPSTGALTGANVLDFCQFDTTARGCSLSRTPSQVAYSAGIQILVTSAASPYTYTTGIDTAAVSADFQ